MRRFDKSKSKPSGYLNIDFNDNQLSIIQPVQRLLTTKHVVESARGDSTRLKTPKRKLDNLGLDFFVEFRAMKLD